MSVEPDAVVENRLTVPENAESYYKKTFPQDEGSGAAFFVHHVFCIFEKV